MKLRCEKCDVDACLVAGVVLYPHRPDLWHKLTWECRVCGDRVGCHRGTDRPLGSLGNDALRRARQDAHAAFDPIWKSGRMKRKAAYRWLAEALHIPRAKAHIGMLDETSCRALIRAINLNFGAQ